MASTIKLKNGSGAPTTGDLVQGEPALDLTNKRLYTENASGVVIEVGTNPSTIDINAGTIDGTVIGGTTAAAGTFTTGQFNTSLNVDGTTNLDVVDIDGAVDMASTLTVGGTTNDGTTLAQIVQSGTGRAFSVNRNVASATRAVVNLAQLQASGGAEAVLDIQQTTPASRAIKVTPDGSIDRFSVYGTGALVTTPVAGGHAVFNEGGADADFRVESATTANALFVEGSSGNVGIGTSSPATALDVVGTVTADGLTVDGAALVSSGNTLTLNRTDNAIGGTMSYVAGTGFIFNDANGDGTSFNVGAANRLRIDSSGNVGIGVSSPLGKLHSSSATSGATPSANGNQVVAENSGNAGITIASGATSLGNIFFADSGDNADGYIQYDQSGRSMRFGTATSEAMRIDASGNLLVGKTATNSATAGAEVRATGALLSAVTSNFCGFFNRISTDGTIIEFAKNDASVGSIGTRASLLKIGTGDVGLLFNSSSDAILPENIDGGVGRDAAIDLGVAGAKFKDLYLSGGVYLGGTGAANLLDDYETGNFDPDVTTANSDMSGITYVSQLGSYVKVGDLVWFRLQVGFSATTIGTGNFRITNLPFVSKNDAEARQSAQVLTYNLTWDSTWQQIATEGVQNSSFIDFLISRSGSTWVNLKATDMSNSTTYYYIVSGCYQTV
jgi:hypothetical protein